MFTGIVEGLGRVAGLELAADGSGARLEVEAPWLVAELGLGDSVAVDGCCLTVTELRGDGFEADVMAESLRRTALGRLHPGDAVNLERPLALGERLGGHLVQGHVDGLGRVLARRALGEGPGGPPNHGDRAQALLGGRGGSELPPHGSICAGARSARRGGSELPPHGNGTEGAEAAPDARARLSYELKVGLLDPDLGRYVVSKGSIAVNGVSLTVAAVEPGWFSVALIPHTLAVTNLGGLRPGDEVQLEVDVLAKYVERLLEPRLAAVGEGGERR